MVAVAMVALLLGGDVLRRKRSVYLNRSNAEAASEWGLLTSAEIYELRAIQNLRRSVGGRPDRRRAGPDRRAGRRSRKAFGKSTREPPATPGSSVVPDPPVPE